MKKIMIVVVAAASLISCKGPIYDAKSRLDFVWCNDHLDVAPKRVLVAGNCLETGSVEVAVERFKRWEGAQSAPDFLQYTGMKAGLTAARDKTLRGGELTCTNQPSKTREAPPFTFYLELYRGATTDGRDPGAQEHFYRCHAGSNQTLGQSYSCDAVVSIENRSENGDATAAVVL
ncbi:MAG: hypothetical protein M3Q07_23480, partial [Pseudobdellovibrionaceae bacterium]|nr:hypothetical protein [Pseudobdellovibrionaceae bacterium]